MRFEGEQNFFGKVHCDIVDGSLKPTSRNQNRLNTGVSRVTVSAPIASVELSENMIQQGVFLPDGKVYDDNQFYVQNRSPVIVDINDGDFIVKKKPGKKKVNKDDE